METIWGNVSIAPPFLTSTLDEGEWSTSCSDHFIFVEKSPRYPLDRKLGCPQNRSGRRGEEFFTLTGNQTPTVQPVDRRNTDRNVLDRSEANLLSLF
jgi:hypothetical protein